MTVAFLANLSSEVKFRENFIAEQRHYRKCRRALYVPKDHQDTNLYIMFLKAEAMLFFLFGRLLWSGLSLPTPFGRITKLPMESGVHATQPVPILTGMTVQLHTPLVDSLFHFA